MEFSKLNLLSLIISFVGGGAVGAALNWIRSDLSDKRNRKIKYTEDQLIHLYGPLYFIISQSDKLFEIEKRYQVAYKEEYIDKQYSRDKLTQERLDEESTKTIEIRNEYIRLAAANNNKIKEILDNNFTYIDAEDIDLVINFFYEHYARLGIEERGKVPFIIHNHIGDISFLRPEFIVGIKNKFLKKKNVLESLSVK